MIKLAVILWDETTSSRVLLKYLIKHQIWIAACKMEDSIKMSSIFILEKTKKQNKTRNVSVSHRCPRPGPSCHFAKNEVEKRAITLIIIGRFYPKLNMTIFYDYIPVYKIWIQYTNQSFLKKYRKENIFWRWKRAITPIIMGWFYPNWNLASILWWYTCV